MEFVVARNPEPGSSLPFLVRLPLRSGAIVLKVRDTWPRTAKIYCHPTDIWPDDPDVIDVVPVRSIERRGVAVDIVFGPCPEEPVAVRVHHHANTVVADRGRLRPDIVAAYTEAHCP